MQHPSLPALRVLFCGGTGDGKSTLIDRLALQVPASVEPPDPGGRPDPGRTPDGHDLLHRLIRESMQRDRALQIAAGADCRTFDSGRRRLFVFDPAHTRALAAAAAAADAVVVLIDVRKDLPRQARLQARIAATLGVRHAVAAVNKMDLVNWSSAAFADASAEFEHLGIELGFATATAVPLSALTGVNLTAARRDEGWYRGPTLIECLEAVPSNATSLQAALRIPVIGIDPPGGGARRLCGPLASGTLREGQPLRILPSGRQVTPVSVLVLPSTGGAEPGSWAGLTLDRALQVEPGSVLTAADDPVEVCDQFEADVVWFSDPPLLAGRPYRMKLHACDVPATVTRIKHRVSLDDDSPLAVKAIARDEIGRVTLAVQRPVPFEPYRRCRSLGTFSLLDVASAETLGAGVIDFALRRASNVRWQALAIDQGARARLMAQRPACVWLTGLPASGKSTIASLLEKRLYAEGRHTYVLDGDNVRHGLNRDLGFTEADRVENVRRVAEVARLMVDAGLIVIVAFISPFRSERDFARSLFAPGEFLEVFVDAPIAVCEARDPKKLYAKARRGQLPHFTGVDSPYEPPLTPDLRLDTARGDPEQSVEALLQCMNEMTPKVRASVPH